MNYNYWNDFLRFWKENYTLLKEGKDGLIDWENPNKYEKAVSFFSPVEESSYYSIEHMPEPWWGNSGNHPLHVVVMNFNRGDADAFQHFDKLSDEFKNMDYSEFIEKEVDAGEDSSFKRNNTWHYVRRAKPILEGLKSIGVDLGENDGLKNYLGVQLMPWRMTNISNVNMYMNNNQEAMIKNSLLFAAESSKKVENDKLRNKVFCRESGTRIFKFLTGLKEDGVIKGFEVIKPNHSGIEYNGDFGRIENNPNSNFYIFRIEDIEDIDFICLWGDEIMTAFPAAKDIGWIIDNIL